MPLLLVVLSVLTAPVHAVQRPADVVKWTAAAQAPATRGGIATIRVTAKVQRGWKLYAIDQPPDGPEPLAFALPDGALFQVVQKQIVAPKAKMQKDENFGVATRYYEDEASFTVPVSLPNSATGDVQQIPLQVTFQACGQNICLRPFTQQLPVAVSVAR